MIPILDTVINAGTTVLNKFVGDKMSEKDALDLKQKFELEILRMANDEKGGFQQFVLDYEGRANEIPKTLVWIRSSVRPIITYAVTGAYGYAFLHPNAFDTERMGVLQGIVLLVLAFWFGDKLVQRTGLMGLMKK